MGSTFNKLVQIYQSGLCLRTLALPLPPALRLFPRHLLDDTTSYLGLYSNVTSTERLSPTTLCEEANFFVLNLLIPVYFLQNILSTCISLFNVAFPRLICELQQNRNCVYFQIPGTKPSPWLMLDKHLSNTVKYLHRDSV